MLLFCSDFVDAQIHMQGIYFIMSQLHVDGLFRSQLWIYYSDVMIEPNFERAAACAANYARAQNFKHNVLDI